MRELEQGDYLDAADSAIRYAMQLEDLRHSRETGEVMTNGVTIVDWIEYGSGREVSIGWCGGFFDNGMRWKDYSKEFTPEFHPYLEALRVEIPKRAPITGHDHQCNNGVPLFSDGTVGEFSLRAWGDLCAAIYAELLDRDFIYMDFYYIYWPEDIAHNAMTNERTDA